MSIGKFFRLFIFMALINPVGIVNATGNLKVLVLIITSDNLPVYPKLQKVWKSYMHSDPEHIEAYFIRGRS